MMNIAEIDKLIEYIGTCVKGHTDEPRATGFNMGNWLVRAQDLEDEASCQDYQGKACGTVACGAGMYGLMYGHDSFPRNRFGKFAANGLGLSRDEGTDLFVPDSPYGLTEITPAMFIAALERVKRGEPPWPNNEKAWDALFSAEEEHQNDLR